MTTKQKRLALAAEGMKIVNQAERQGRQLTQAERAQVNDLILQANVHKLAEGLESPCPGEAGGGALNAIRAAGWELGGPAVSLPFGAVLIDNAADAAPLREVGIVRQGADGRRLYPALEQRPLDGATRVDELVSTGRSLADPEAMQLAIDATSEKPVTASGATLESYDVKMVATVSDPYPNAIVSLPAFADLVNVDMTIAYQDSLDNLVVNTITDAAGTTDDAGDDLFEQLRKAVTVLQGEGFNPTLAAVSPEDAETLDLSRSGGSTTDDGPFILSPAPRASGFTPLWNLALRVVKGLDAPIVLDPSVIRLYLDRVTFASDPFSGFSTNETRFRFEGPAIPVVRQPMGVYVIGAS